MFENGFPIELKKDFETVLQLISRGTYNNINLDATEQSCTYILLNGETISFPYRIYCIDQYNTLPASLTFEQKMIYHAIFTRSSDGFVREKHIESILKEEFPEWIIPYIIKVSDEYVIEILETVYNAIRDINTDKIKDFCCLNVKSFLYSHDRMISYWNEFYRNQNFYYKDYIGKKLFSECFGYTRSMEKERKNRV
ncbi:hypothetical protein [Aminipila sp.]|uniref:hypothetical protein n=1 Tax=Aminipila sp. TaxID=2060095 RepID=UPI0028A2D301|nr:hypothetical protein [Aminipila sp.]